MQDTGNSSLFFRAVERNPYKSHVFMVKTTCTVVGTHCSKDDSLN